MIRGTLTRAIPGPDLELGTFGKLILPGIFECYTVEPPPLAEHGCIPPGAYLFRWRKDSPTHGECYEAQNVPGRTNIQIHTANWADQLLGCIAPGRAIVDVKRKDGTLRKGVTSSADALAALVGILEKNLFELKIIQAEGPYKENE